jgi:hypothetical protein
MIDPSHKPPFQFGLGSLLLLIAIIGILLVIPAVGMGVWRVLANSGLLGPPSMGGLIQSSFWTGVAVGLAMACVLAVARAIFLRKS